MDAILITHHPKSGHFQVHGVKNLVSDSPKTFDFHPIFPQYHLAQTFAQAMAAMYGIVTHGPKDNKES